jgi:hypothetical protein
MSDTKLRQAILKDFKELLVEEFTTDWKAQRFLIEMYLSVMSLDNTIELFNKLNEENKELRNTINEYAEEELQRQEDEMMDYLIKEEEKFNDYSFMED